MLNVSSFSGKEIHDLKFYSSFAFYLDVKNLVLAIFDELSESEKPDVLRLWNFLDHSLKARDASALEFIVSFILEAVGEEVDDIFVFGAMFTGKSLN